MPVNKDFYTLAGSSGQSTGYTINQSIRFNDDDSAYMHRTPSSTGNRKKFTYSAWIKLGALGINRWLPFPNVNQNANYGLYLTSSDVMNIFIYYTGSAWQGQLYPTQVFRDPTAWYHFVLAVDTTDSVSQNRIKFFVNGERITNFSTENYPNQNQDTDFNNASEKMWIASASSSAGTFFDGYAADIHWLDGYAYGPEYFGEFDDYGIWIPKEYTGSYGTNGFKIDGRDSGDLGDDESGQGNDFTTSGRATHDQMIDTPTNNFCTMNSAAKYDNAAFTISNGNLDLTRTSGNNMGVYATIGLTSGKWYWEVRTIHGTSYNIEHGVIGEHAGAIIIGSDISAGTQASGYSLQFNTGDYYKRHSGSSTDTSVNAASPSFQAFAVDMDNKKIWFGYAADGDSSITWFESGDPAGGSNAIYDLDDGSDTYYPHHNSSRGNGTQQARFNFGQDGSFAGEESASQTDSNGEGNFFFAPPSGFLAICTKNLQA